MSQPDQQNGGAFVPALVVVVVSLVVLDNAGPLNLNGPEINAVAALAWFFLVMSGCALAGEVFRMIGGLFEVLRARTPQGLKGTAGWVKHRWQIWRDHVWFGWAPYWGVLKGKPIFSWYESVALTIGPPGSGKSVGVVMAIILSIRGSKIIPDFKGNLGLILGGVLRACGEKVITVNLGNVFSDEYGPSAKYNPLCLVTDLYWNAGALRDVLDELTELALQLVPEKDEISGENKYFRDGPRDLIEFAMLIVTLVHGERGNLGHVAQLLSNREDLLWHALWASGRLPILEENAG